jgi:IMP dehydrogenase
MTPIETALTFDDVQIMPNYSEITSRSDCDTSAMLVENDSYNLTIPIISSPMDTISEHEMIIGMRNGGGVAAVHRFNTIEEQVEQIKTARKSNPGYMEPIVDVKKFVA